MLLIVLQVDSLHPPNASNARPRGGQSQSPRNGTVQHKRSSSAPLLLVVRGLQWRRHLTRSVAAVEILQSCPLKKKNYY